MEKGLYVLMVRPEGHWPTEPTIRLRGFLKVALRRFGLRCISAREIQEESAKSVLDLREQSRQR